MFMILKIQIYEICVNFSKDSLIGPIVVVVIRGQPLSIPASINLGRQERVEFPLNLRQSAKQRMNVRIVRKPIVIGFRIYIAFIVRPPRLLSVFIDVSFFIPLGFDSFDTWEGSSRHLV